MALGKIEGNTVLDTNGNPVSGAVVRFYEVGTLTAKTIYSDQALSVSLGSFITTDSAGRFTLPYTTNPYKIRVETSTTDSTLIYEQDHIGQDIADVNTQTEGLLTVANVQNSVGTFATTGGSGSAYTVTLSQALTSYQTGQNIKFKANHTNTGAATINVSNVGVVPLQGNLGTNLVAGDIVADGVYEIIYDGSGWKLTNSQGTNQSTIQVNTINELTVGSGVTADGVLLKDNDVTAKDATFSGAMQAASGVITGSTLTVSSNQVWHSGNDGSGTGLDADLLDGQQGTYYRNASNINAGTINDAHLPATISSNITGNAATATNATNATNATTATNSTQLNGQSASFYTNASNLSSGLIPDARLQTTGTYTPVISNITSGSVVPFDSIARAEWIKQGDKCLVNCLFDMGTSPENDEGRMTLPFNANNLQLVGLCWAIWNNASYPTASDIDDAITTDSIAFNTTVRGAGLVRDGFFYFKGTGYETFGTPALNAQWLYITFEYRTT